LNNLKINKMKNIFILPTDQPSRLVKIKDTFFLTSTDSIPGGTFYNIYITSDEEIEEGDWGVDDENVLTKFCTHFAIHSQTYFNYQKVVLTTDPTLITDGVQSIDDEFLKWFVKNSSCEFVEVKRDFADEGIKGITYYGKYFVIIPQEEPNPFELPKALPDDVFYQSLEPKQETLEEAAEKYSESKSSASVFQDAHKRDFIEGAKWQSERMQNELNKWFEQF